MFTRLGSCLSVNVDGQMKWEIEVKDDWTNFHCSRSPEMVPSKTTYWISKGTKTPFPVEGLRQNAARLRMLRDSRFPSTQTTALISVETTQPTRGQATRGNINALNTTPERRKHRALRVNCRQISQNGYYLFEERYLYPNIQTQHLPPMTCEASGGPFLALLVRPSPCHWSRWGPIFGSLWPAAPLDHLHEGDYSALRHSIPPGCGHFLLLAWICACLVSSLCSSLAPPQALPCSPSAPARWSSGSLWSSLVLTSDPEILLDQRSPLTKSIWRVMLV